MALQIAMFSWESLHSIAIGGLAPHASELAAALHRRGHEVHLFTRQGQGQALYDRVDGVHYHRCPYIGHPDFMSDVGRMNDSFVWHFAETEHFLGRPFDVVHGHDWLSVFALARAKNYHKRPSVMTVHSTEWGRCGNSLWDDPLSRRIRDLEWEGTFIADRVICVSRTLCGEVHSQYGVPKDKLSSIYNGVHAWKYDNEVDVHAVRRRYEIGADDPCILFAGRLTWQKGPDLLVEAVPDVLKTHPRTKVVFAGDGDMRPGLENRVRQMGIDPSTRFLGYRNGGELINLFKSTDVVCVPSRNEPFGIVILEAWSAGKPVVATRIGGPEEFVHDDYNGLKVSADPESISRGLDSMLSDREGSLEMGRNGRHEAQTRFSWDQAAAETESVYESIFDGRDGTFAAFSNGESSDMARQVGKSATKTEKTEPQGRVVAAKAPATPTAIHQGPTHEDIRKRAYAIYLARGGIAGDPVADWLQAERDLKSELKRKTEAQPVSKAPVVPSTAKPIASKSTRR